MVGGAGGEGFGGGGGGGGRGAGAGGGASERNPTESWSTGAKKMAPVNEGWARGRIQCYGYDLVGGVCDKWMAA